MSTENLEAAIASSRQVLAGVSSGDLGASTPCESWDVAALINHMVGGAGFFAAALRGEAPDGESNAASGDFLSEFDAATAVLISEFQAEGVLEKMHELPFGTMPGSAFMGLAMTDIFQHGWDLAKATGQNTDLSPQLATGLLHGSRAAISENFRGPEGAPFGAEQSAGSDASAADQLAAFLGRKV